MNSNSSKTLKNTVAAAVIAVPLTVMSSSQVFVHADTIGWRVIGQQSGETGIYRGATKDTVKEQVRLVRAGNAIDIEIARAGNAIDIEFA